MKKYKKRYSDSVTATQWFKLGDHWAVKLHPGVPGWGITEDGSDVLLGDYVVELGHGEIEIYTMAKFDKLFEPATPGMLRIYYSIQNNGNGSASSKFMDSRELAEWDQDHLDEGWGDESWGELDMVSATPITVEKVMSTIGYYIWKETDEYWTYTDRDEFESKFFPSGLPKFEARMLEGCDKYYYVFVAGVQHYRERGWSRKAKKFEISEAGLVKFQKTLDKLGQHESS